MSLALSAAFSGDTALFSRVISIDAASPINCKDDDGDHCLLLAAYQGHCEIMKSLLDIGFEVDKRGFNGQTSLMCACFTGKLEAASMLLEAKASVDLKDDMGMTALMYAGLQNHKDIVDLLVTKYEAKITEQDQNGLTVVDHVGLLGNSSGMFADSTQLQPFVEEHRSVWRLSSVTMVQLMQMRARKGSGYLALARQSELATEVQRLKKELKTAKTTQENAALHVKAMQLQVENLQQSLEAERRKSETETDWETRAKEAEKRVKIHTKAIDALQGQLKEAATTSNSTICAVLEESLQTAITRAEEAEQKWLQSQTIISDQQRRLDDLTNNSSTFMTQGVEDEIDGEVSLGYGSGAVAMAMSGNLTTTRGVSILTEKVKQLEECLGKQRQRTADLENVIRQELQAERNVEIAKRERAEALVESLRMAADEAETQKQSLVKTLGEEKERLESELNGIKRQVGLLQAELREQQPLIASLEQKNLTLTTSLEQSQATRIEHLKKMDIISDKLAAQLQHNEKLTHKVNELTSEIKMLQENLGKAGEDKAELLSVLGQKDKEIQMVAQAAAKHSKEAYDRGYMEGKQQGTSEQSVIGEEAIAAMESIAKQAQSRCIGLQDDLDEADVKIRTLTSKLREKEAQLETEALKRYHPYPPQVEVIEVAVEQLTKERDDLKQKLVESNHFVEKLQLDNQLQMKTIYSLKKTNIPQQHTSACVNCARMQSVCNSTIANLRLQLVQLKETLQSLSKFAQSAANYQNFLSDQRRRTLTQTKNTNILKVLESMSKTDLEEHLMITLTGADDLRMQNAQLHSMLMESRGGMRLICRIRPRLLDEAESHTVVSVNDNRVVSMYVPPMGPVKTFAFDAAFPECALASEIMEEVTPLLPCVLDGSNVSLLFFGGPSTGKMYTLSEILGLSELNSRVSEGALVELYRIVQQRQALVSTQVAFSAFEIGEDVLDVSPEVASREDSLKLDIRGGVNGAHVHGMSEVVIASVEDALDFCSKVLSIRKFRGGDKSHLVIQLRIRCRSALSPITESKLSFVLLAPPYHTKIGIEREKDLQWVNNSLHSLSDVFSALSRGSYVPWRNSKLTRALADVLGPPARRLLITCVAPSNTKGDQTISSLQYAMRCKGGQAHAINNKSKKSEQLPQQQQPSSPPVVEEQQALVTARDVDAVRTEMATTAAKERANNARVIGQLKAELLVADEMERNVRRLSDMLSAANLMLAATPHNSDNAIIIKDNSNNNEITSGKKRLHLGSNRTEKYGETTRLLNVEIRWALARLQHLKVLSMDNSKPTTIFPKIESASPATSRSDIILNPVPPPPKDNVNLNSNRRRVGAKAAMRLRS